MTAIGSSTGVPSVPSFPSPYPAAPPARDAWIRSHRPARTLLDPLRPYAFQHEEERTASGEIAAVATIFLTNRECPWRCLMCDLWRNTLEETVPVGAIPTQIDYALSCLPKARQIKLYNSGSFFDPRAIPKADYPAIAARLYHFERVVVESHPALVGEDCLRFRDLLYSVRDRAADERVGDTTNAWGQGENSPDPFAHRTSEAGTTTPPLLPRMEERRHSLSSVPKLEVAMGLETANAEVLARLNKRMTLDQFARAAEWLHNNDISLRAFVLVKPPFISSEQEALHWAERSIDFAFDCGATVVSLIPTRFGNGALEALAKPGQFAPPKLITLERATEYGVALALRRGFDTTRATQVSRPVSQVSKLADVGNVSARSVLRGPAGLQVENTADLEAHAPAEEPRIREVWPGHRRVFADLWDLEKFSNCAHCFPTRLARLREMNMGQTVLPPVRCANCRLS